MNLDELKQLIQILESSGLGELEIEEDGRRIRLSKQGVAPVAVAMPAVAAPAPAAPAAPPATPQAAAPVPEPASKSAGLDAGLVSIDAPMVGTFYTAGSPGDPPFVKPGDTVTPETVVCIVEAMKIMNEVQAKVNGVIERVLVATGEPVEYAQPLFAVRPL